MSRQLITAIMLMCGLAALIAGCSEDCPTCPTETKVEPYKGWLYYVELNPQLYDVYVVDMETDSIVDSIDVPTEPTGFLDVSEDGRYLAVTASPLEDIGVHCYLYDAQTREYIGELSDRMGPFFDLTNNLVVGNVPVENGEYGGVRVLSYPSLSLVHEDQIPGIAYGVEVIDPPRHTAYGAISRRDGGKSNQLYSYDYVDREFTHYPIIDQIYEDTAGVFRMCLNSAGTRVFFRAAVAISFTERYEFVGAYDLPSRTLIWQKQVRGAWGGIGISPDDQELYVHEVGYIPDFLTGVIFVLDPNTGAQLHAYSSFGWLDNQYQPIGAEEPIFSPTGDKLYVGGGSLGQGAGMLALFDPRERELVKFITPDFHRAIGRMAIGPKLE